jgi:hypothetical protein
MRKKIINTLFYLLLAAGIFFAMYKIYLRNNNRNDEADIVQWIAIGALLAALLCRYLPRIFPKWFINRSTSDEFDERSPGN